jgi:hypothetical protein
LVPSASAVTNQTKESEDRLAAIIENPKLASSVVLTLNDAIRSQLVEFVKADNAWDIVQASLNSVAFEIAAHKRGPLLQRLLIHGPAAYYDPEMPRSDGMTQLSDPECGLCVEFIFSHMVNRFKGELAELLAIGPVLELVRELTNTGRLPASTRVYWGDSIRERRRIADTEGNLLWGSFAKGADGLLVDGCKPIGPDRRRISTVWGIVEVKSMLVSTRRVLAQIEQHVGRLHGGLLLQGYERPGDEIRISGFDGGTQPIRIMVVPSNWRVSRDWKSTSTKIILPPYHDPPLANRITETAPGTWKITLAWSVESLAEAAFGLTFWYMAKAGQHLSAHSALPRHLDRMSPQEAGRNMIKQALYFLVLRPLKPRELRRAITLFNVYSFGFSAGIDSAQALSPEDFDCNPDRAIS